VLGLVAGIFVHKKVVSEDIKLAESVKKLVAAKVAAGKVVDEAKIKAFDLKAIAGKSEDAKDKQEKK
jgi:hypothetical protein